MSEWKALVTIARWEFVQRIRTPMLIVLLIASPLITILTAFAPLSSSSEPRTERQTIVGIMNAENRLHDIQDYFQRHVTLKNTTPKYVFVPALGGDEDAYYPVLLNLHDAPNYSVDILKSDRDFRTEALLISQVLSALDKGSTSFPSVYDMRQPETSSPSKTIAMSLLLSLISLHLLTLTLVSGSGQLLIRSMFEEKQTRLFDVMISSSSPRTFLLGKYIGVMLFGLVQALLWILIAMAAASLAGYTNISTHLPIIALCSVSSFILFTSLYLLIAAGVENDSSAQTATYFTTLAALLPLSLTLQSFTAQGGITDILQYIPLFAPNIAAMKKMAGMQSELGVTYAVASALVTSLLIVTLAIRLFERKIRYGSILGGKAHAQIPAATATNPQS